MDALYFKQSDGYIYVYSRSKDVLFKYNSPRFGLLLLLFYDKDDLTPLQESDLSHFDCEIVDVKEGGDI